MPILRQLVPVLAICSLALPASAFAWEPPAGSPPGWHSPWVQTIERVDVFVHADGDLSFGQAPAGLFFRVDAPAQRGRLWVYDPLGGSWAWIAISGTEPVPTPIPEQVAASAQALDPREYLYQQAPGLAPRLDCIINGESGWEPSQQNARSRAAGLAQFIPSTWATTPEGQQGLSPFEPLANIDAAIWLARTRAGPSGRSTPKATAGRVILSATACGCPNRPWLPEPAAVPLDAPRGEPLKGC